MIYPFSFSWTFRFYIFLLIKSPWSFLPMCSFIQEFSPGQKLGSGVIGWCGMCILSCTKLFFKVVCWFTVLPALDEFPSLEYPLDSLHLSLVLWVWDNIKKKKEDLHHRIFKICTNIVIGIVNFCVSHHPASAIINKRPILYYLHRHSLSLPVSQRNPSCHTILSANTHYVPLAHNSFTLSQIASVTLSH